MSAPTIRDEAALVEELLVSTLEKIRSFGIELTSEELLAIVDKNAGYYANSSVLLQLYLFFSELQKLKESHGERSTV